MTNIFDTKSKHVKTRLSTKKTNRLFIMACLIWGAISLPTMAENIRLVLSHKNIVSEGAISSNTSIDEVLESQIHTANFSRQRSTSHQPKYRLKQKCMNTADGAQNICTPVRMLISDDSINNPIVTSQTINTASSFNTIESDTDAPFSVVDIEVGESTIEAIKETLEKSGWYAAVEEEIKVYTTNNSLEVSIGTTSADDVMITPAALLYNDPNFSEQTYLFSSESELSGSSFISLMSAKEASTAEQTTIGVAVLDSGFYPMDEIDYEGGYNFVTGVSSTSFYDNIDEYINDKIDAGDDACLAHATGVASIIGAKTNNNKNIVGAAGNVAMHALKVLDCDEGNLTDVANALNAIAGISGNGYPAYEHNNTIKIANLSLGATASCSTYMQTAINNANDAGILVVVSAGNDSTSASSFVPANCENVVVVAALNNAASKASFSNDGSSVDISAQGEDVLGLNYDEATYLWSGTSFSAPLVTSAATYMYRENPDLTPEMAELIIKISSQPIQGLGCNVNNCGSGLVNAAAMAELAANMSEEGVNKITYRLSDESTCDQQWYFEQFGDSVALCSLLKLTFASELTGEQFYQLYSVPINNLSNETLIKDSFQSSSIVMSKTAFDFVNNYYVVKVCDDNSCFSSIPLDTTEVDGDNSNSICP